ncbi:phage major capsid protein [uncultured Sphingomonas sp.]|uniref:phage major capsid protein n=1 Tax=uncultured Sphingomonas sp. TaxID=158754 RepID=UPI0026019243|nr:phage major capsid protein [uncultured Sphingomonas sp.]
MSKLAALLEKRTAIVARMNEAHTADNDNDFKAAETELRGLDTQIDRQRALDAADRTDLGTPLTGERTPEFRNYSLARRIAAQLDPTIDAGRELEIEQELQRRSDMPAQGIRVPLEYFETRDAQTTATSAAIVPTDFRPELFTSALTAATVMQTMGATVLTGLSGNVVIPRETGSPNVGWVNENEALPTGNASFDSLTLAPHHVGAITELSRQLIMQASPAADGILRQMLSRNIALEIDRAAIAGTGTNAQPTGILNDPLVPTVAFDTDLFTTTANMIGKADLANVGNTRSFLSTNGVKGVAAKTRDTNGHPIPFAEIFHNEPARFSNQVPANLAPNANKHGLIYGDWSDFLIGIWSQLDILVNPYAETAYSKGNILIRAMATVDFGVRRPASFVKATGVAAA